MHPFIAETNAVVVSNAGVKYPMELLTEAALEVEEMQQYPREKYLQIEKEHLKLFCAVVSTLFRAVAQFLLRDLRLPY